MSDSEKAAKEIYEQLTLAIRPFDDGDCDEDGDLILAIKSPDGKWTSTNATAVTERIRQIIDKHLC